MTIVLQEKINKERVKNVIECDNIPTKDKSTTMDYEKYLASNGRVVYQQKKEPKVVIKTVDLKEFANDPIFMRIRERLNSTSQQLFINSYYAYIKYDDEKDYVVDLDDVYESIGFSNKGNAKRLLEKYYKLDIDYKVFIRSDKNLNDDGKAAIKGGVGQNKQKIMMNIITFKKFCTRADTTEAEEIHDYYLLMEKIILEYTKEQLQLKDKENKKLEEENKRLIEYNERKYEEVEKNGHIYVFSTDKLGIVKIGRTKGFVKKRVSGLQTALIDDIKILFDYNTSNDQLLENIVHYILDRYRCNSNREHFECKLEYIKTVIEMAGKMIHTLKSSFQNISHKEICEKLEYKIEYYSIYEQEGVEYTSDIKSVINKEKRENDPIGEFLEEYIEKTKNQEDIIKVSKLLDTYMSLNKLQYISSRERGQIKKTFIIKLGEPIQIYGHQSWRKIKYKN